jgi:hypothetical protein
VRSADVRRCASRTCDSGESTSRPPSSPRLRVRRTKPRVDVALFVRVLHDDDALTRRAIGVDFCVVIGPARGEGDIGVHDRGSVALATIAGGELARRSATG